MDVDIRGGGVIAIKMVVVLVQLGQVPPLIVKCLLLLKNLFKKS